MDFPEALDLNDWRQAYGQGARPSELLAAWLARIERTDPAWISIASEEAILAQVAELPRRRAARGTAALPLDGIPFAIKDNIDALGFATTAACPAFSRVPTSDATVVARLRELGAIVVGKTNLDQFATGLVGTRSPYGVVPSSFDPERAGGGSSSGSAAVVARGLVPFALGTDTAGSGRVPAAFHNIVGYKPTRGRFSTRGVVPACRTLDCVSIFGLTVDDVVEIASYLDAFDPLDAYARRAPEPRPALPIQRVAVPAHAEFFGDRLAEAAFANACAALPGFDIEVVPLDFSAFRQLAELLYAASWVAERSLVAGDLIDQSPPVMDAVVEEILRGGRAQTAEQAFAAEYRRAELARAIDQTFDQVDLWMVPTTPTCFRLSDIAADPMGTNARLGTYTNFTNLADLCGLAVPGPFREDGFPAGITLLGRAHTEARLVELGRRLQASYALPLGATGRSYRPLPTASPPAPQGASGTMLVAVVGAHMSGLALNTELTSRGASFVARSRTAPRYELRLLAGGTGPARPGLFRLADDQGPGATIELELWSIPLTEIGGLLQKIPPPLGLGRVLLEDGAWVTGFICEPIGKEGSTDISSFGGFRAFLASRS